MDITKKSFTISLRLSKNYQSVEISEGFEVEVNDEFNEFDFETKKTEIKDRLADEAKQYLKQATAKPDIDLEL